MGHIKFDKRNFRKHSDDNKSLIRKSLEQYGAGRSVVVDADDELIAGNGVYEQAEAMGIPTRVIETDGTELVVVKRTDLHTDDEKRKGLAMADNATSDKVEWDFDALRENFTPEALQAFRINVPKIIAPEDAQDLSDKIKPSYRVEVTLADENAQEALYNKLIEEGYECRILTL